jgi:hypothetical protein
MNLLLRAKLLTLSGVLALAGLSAGVAPAALACSMSADGTSNENPPCPPLKFISGPGQVDIGAPDNSPFSPGASVRLEALTPGFGQVLATEWVTVDPCGHFGTESTDCNNSYARLDVDKYVGTVWIMADQYGDATHPYLLGMEGGISSVAQLSALSANATGPVLSGPGTLHPVCAVSVSGSGFGIPATATFSGQSIQVQILDAQGNPVPVDASNTTTTTLGVDTNGNINAGINIDYNGPGQVVATPITVGQPVKTGIVNLCGSTPGMHSVVPPSPTPTSAATSGGSTSTGGAGGFSGSGGSAPPRVHAAE